jgi:hypothetical protein
MYFHSPPYMQTGFSIFINIAVATGDNAAWQIASGPLQARRALDAWVPHGHGHGHGHVHGHARGYLLEQPQEPIQPICRFFFVFICIDSHPSTLNQCLSSLAAPPLMWPTWHCRCYLVFLEAHWAELYWVQRAHSTTAQSGWSGCMAQVRMCRPTTLLLIHPLFVHHYSFSCATAAAHRMLLLTAPRVLCSPSVDAHTHITAAAVAPGLI